MMSEQKLSLVILNYMDYMTTIHLVDMIIDYNGINDIIIIDNHSRNESFEVLSKRYSSKCHVLQSDANKGYAAGNNIGIKYAIERTNSDIICVINPDVEFEQYVIASIRTAFEYSDFALLSPIMKDIDGNISKHPYWNLPTYWNDLGSCFTLYRKYQYNKTNSIDYSLQIMPVDVLPGSFLAFKKDALIDVGFFDDTLFLYCEERMISHKLLAKKYKVGLITNAYYSHMHSKITKQYLKQMQIDRLTAKARYYYEIEYNHINLIQRILLRIAMAFSFFELAIARKIREVLH